MEASRFQLGCLHCSTHTIAQLVDEVRALLRDTSLRPRTILCVNAHIYNLACSDAALRQTLNEARIVAADGVSIIGAARLFGRRIPQRCNMTEAFRAFLQADDIRHNEGVLLGLTEEEARLAAANIECMSAHCRIVRCVSGYLSDAEYERILRSLPAVDFAFVGMGTPKTERVARIAAGACPQAIVWGIGGGTMKIFAGSMQEAPALMRRWGLQWLYRLYREPSRLWRRYLIGNFLFICRILVSALKRRRR